MFLDRRGFVAAGSAALLSGCATIVPGRAGCSALPPVAVDASRVIRTVAGLRPYRASGFVVRRELLGGVHVLLGLKERDGGARAEPADGLVGREVAAGLWCRVGPWSERERG